MSAEVPAELIAARFAPHVGSAFTVAGESGLTLLLAEVQEGPEQPGAPREHPFTLVFTAPAGTAAPQATYDLDHSVLGRLNVFLVPRQPEADGLARYEADFN
jgi:hypothetical protein